MRGIICEKEVLYRVLCERSAKQYQQMVIKNLKKFYVKLVAIFEIEGLLALEISKFTKICKFQKKLYAHLRLLNDCGLIISIKTNKKTYVCVYALSSKLETLQARESTFSF